MKNSLKFFLFGLSISLLVILSFFVGAIADRIFVVKPLDYFLSKRVGLSTPQNAAPTSFTSEEKNVVDVAENASKSVVTVSMKQQQPIQQPSFNDFFGFGFPGLPQQSPAMPPQKAQQDIGSGFVVDGGLVITNKHVVSDSSADYFVIDREDKEHKVTKIYRDPVNDLAVLKVENLNEPPIQLGDSDALKVGQTVIAIGTALGQFRHTVTKGVVSGLGRGIEAGDPFGTSTESLQNAIQTDAAINPGNSGGPLVDSAGRVIGVNVAVSEAAQNIGFAIPINVIKTSLRNFNETGKFNRPFFGVRYRMISEQAALFNSVPQGAYVVEVVPNSSAADGGIQVGDIISEFDGQKLKDSDLAKLINQKKVGERVNVKLWRKEKELNVTVTLKEQS